MRKKKGSGLSSGPTTLNTAHAMTRAMGAAYEMHESGFNRRERVSGPQLQVGAADSGPSLPLDDGLALAHVDSKQLPGVQKGRDMCLSHPAEP